MDVMDICSAADASAWCKYRHDAEISDELAEYIVRYMPKHPQQRQSWIRNRIYYAGLMPGLVGSAVNGTRLGVDLHVFFLYIEETPEHLEMLQRDPSALDQLIARSKISKTNEVISPIDRVAHRVTGDF